jgi:hypothetical protein
VTRATVMLLGAMGLVVAAAGIGFAVLMILAMSGGLQGLRLHAGMRAA